MAVQQSGHYQSNWVVSEKNANVEHLLDFAERMQIIEALSQPANVSVTLQGSIIGVTVNGDLESVRKDFENLENRLFTQAQLTATFPQQNSLNMSLTLNPPQRILSLNLKNAIPRQAESILEALREEFPAEVGFTHEELSEKSRQIGSVIEASSEIKQRLSESWECLRKIEDVLKEASNRRDAAVEAAKTANEMKGRANDLHNEVRGYQSEAAKLLPQIQNTKSQVDADAVTTKKNRDEIGAIREDINKFFGEIQANRKQLAEQKKSVDTLLRDANEKTDAIISKNIEQQIEIDKHLLKAVGTSLFGAFEKRRQKIVTAKWIWAGLSFIACSVQAAAVVWLTYEAEKIGGGNVSALSQPMFIIKATVALPILYLIYFCVKQYSKERDHEETYGFKAALSFSLSPYLDLVKGVNPTADGKEYKEFVVKTIGQVFQEPAIEVGKAARTSANGPIVPKELTESLKYVAEILRK